MPNLYLGMEYVETNDPRTMDQFMAAFADGDQTVTRKSHFKIINAQVSCFGGLAAFDYDDVSGVHVLKGRTPQLQYCQNVTATANLAVGRINLAQPSIILVGGDNAFVEFLHHIVPAIPNWSGDIVKVRNASSQAHHGEIAAWLNLYAAFQHPDFGPPLGPAQKRLWHLKTSGLGHAFELNPLAW